MTITKDSTLEDLYQTGKINIRIYNSLCRYFKMTYPDTIDFYNSGNQIRVGDICKLSHHKLMNIRNLGIASVTILCEALESFGFAVPGYEKSQADKELILRKHLYVNYECYKRVSEVLPGEIVRGDDEHYYMKLGSLTGTDNDIFVDLTKHHMVTYIGSSVLMVPCYSNPFKG